MYTLLPVNLYFNYTYGLFWHLLPQPNTCRSDNASHEFWGYFRGEKIREGSRLGYKWYIQPGIWPI